MIIYEVHLLHLQCGQRCQVINHWSAALSAVHVSRAACRLGRYIFDLCASTDQRYSLHWPSAVNFLLGISHKTILTKTIDQFFDSVGSISPEDLVPGPLNCYNGLSSNADGSYDFLDQGG